MTSRAPWAVIPLGVVALCLVLASCSSGAGTVSTQSQNAVSPQASPTPSASPSPTCADDLAFLNTVFAGYVVARTRFNTIQGQSTAKGQHAYLSAVTRLRAQVLARHFARPLADADHVLVLGFDKILRGGRKEFRAGQSITAMVLANNVLRAGDVAVARAKLAAIKVRAAGTCT